MKFKAQFKVSDLARDVNTTVDRLEQMIENELVLVGLEFVREARIKADFTDRTGNLRSSIGFMVLKNGSPIYQDFEKSRKGTDRDTGKIIGLEAAYSLASRLTGFVLICVAGMEYAVYVEANGFDVITGSTLKASDNLTKGLERLTNSLNQQQ